MAVRVAFDGLLEIIDCKRDITRVKSDPTKVVENSGIVAYSVRNYLFRCRYFAILREIEKDNVRIHISRINFECFPSICLGFLKGTLALECNSKVRVSVSDLRSEF